uniref:histidine--tRNA ligase n=1 Tax=Panagrellus redivivus TaxID=6233 RepID=A0A7E4VLT9_PANRE
MAKVNSPETEPTNPTKPVKEQLAKAMEKKAKIGDAKVTLKTPKGTRDYGPKSMVIREKVLKTIVDTFKRHGAETIDTPVFELRDVLLGKYGEEGGKLVFDLADQGGELCSLRYDLTVPFARYLAMNKIQNLKRYHIAKVYRRDQPVMTKGRYREFYQCDFDIAGQYDLMVPEAECIRVVDEVMTQLDLGDFEIRLNHRLLLEGMFSLSGIADKDFKTVCSSVDKLDKSPWAEVANELINEKKIDEAAVNKLEQYVRLRAQNPDLDNLGLLEKFLEDPEASQNASIVTAVKEIKVLLEYVELFGANQNVVFEPSLARGLDYYTGAIYEVVIKEFSFSGLGGTKSDNPDDQVSVGSVAAGGRYDKLVGIFAGGKGKSNVPCVGVSFGIERLFSIMEAKAATEEMPGRTNATQVYVAAAQKGLLKARMNVIRQLWDAGFNAETSFKANPKLLDQMQYCEARFIPWVLIIGESELAAGVIQLKNVKDREDVKVIPIADMEKELTSRLNGST